MLASDQYRKMQRKNKELGDRPLRSQTNELGSGDLATAEHIKTWTTKNDEFDTCLPVEGLRGSSGVVVQKGELVIPGGERNRHILIIAKTGSGKTTKLILPVLYHDCLCRVRSTIVIDSKPEMWSKLAGLTRKYNPDKQILLFNPLDTLRSLSWNILGKVEDDTDAKLIANTIITATDGPAAKQDSPFFRNNALQILNGLMIGLLNDNNEILSMPRVHELVHGGMQNLCDWLEAHPHALRNTRTFVELARSGSQNADTIMSELGMRLAAWDLSAIRSTTAFSEIDLETLISQPTLFIVEFRESELEMLRPMANVIVVELLRFLTKRAESCPGSKLPRPVSLVIDEFASALGRLPDIHVKLNTLRSRNVSIVAAIQSIAQVKANYEKDADSVLAGFSTKILMPALDFQDSEWASKETGTMTVRYMTSSSGKNKRMVDYFAHQNQNLNEQIQQRAVLTPDEIGRPVDNISTFFMPNTPVFQGHLVPFYKIPDMLERINTAEGLEVQLRDKPIEYEEHLPEPGPSQKTGSSGHMQIATGQVSSDQLTPEQLRQSLEQIKAGLDWAQTRGSARQWWELFEQANANNIIAVLSLAKEIGARKATIAEFYSVFANSGTDDLELVLRKLTTELIQWRKVSHLAWNTARGAAKEWWSSFEEANSNNQEMILQLIQELMLRKATVDDFFSVYIKDNCKSVPDVLMAIDRRQAEAYLEGEEAEIQPVDDPQLLVSPVVQEEFVEQQFEPTLNQHTQESQSQDLTSAANAAVKTKPSGADDARRAAASVQLESYLSMGRQFLSAGNVNDFNALIALAKDDRSLSETDISLLSALTAEFDTTD